MKGHDHGIEEEQTSGYEDCYTAVKSRHFRNVPKNQAEEAGLDLMTDATTDTGTCMLL